MKPRWVSWDELRGGVVGVEHPVESVAPIAALRALVCLSGCDGLRLWLLLPALAALVVRLKPFTAATTAAVEGIHGVKPGALLAEPALAYLQLHRGGFPVLKAHLEPAVVRLVDAQIGTATRDLAAGSLGSRDGVSTKACGSPEQHTGSGSGCCEKRQ